MNKKLIFSVLLVCLLAFVAVMAFGQNSPNVRWEYRVIDLSDSGVRNYAGGIPRINELGREGWELITTSAMTGELIFKRRLP